MSAPRRAGAPEPPLTAVRELARRSDHDRTVLCLDRLGRTYVEKHVPAPLANAQVWRTMEAMDHPGVVPVYAVEEEPWGLRVTMGHVPGPTLEELVEKHGALDPDLAADLAARAAEGAGALHARGVVHRDLSPANVVAGPDGACIVDAGIARMPAPDAKRHDTVPLGTAGFAAPEQYGFAETSPRTDVYALGRLCGYLMTGVTPTSPVFEDALADDAVVSPGVRAVIERACSLEPSARQADGTAFARDLRRAAGRELPVASSGPVRVREEAVSAADPARAVSPGRRRLARAALAAGVLFLALMASGLLMEPSSPRTPQALWDFQCLSTGLTLGLAPGLSTRWFLLRERWFSSARHPAALWAATLAACLVAAIVLVGASQAAAGPPAP